MSDTNTFWDAIIKATQQTIKKAEDNIISEFLVDLKTAFWNHREYYIIKEKWEKRL